MKPTIDSILQNQLHQLQAVVIMSAYTDSAPGWLEQKQEPDFYRFCYTEKGKGWLEIEGEKYSIQPETLYFMPAGTLQSFGTDGDEPFGRYWCHFRLELSDVQVISSLQLPRYIYVKEKHKIKALFHKMVECQQLHSITKDLRLKAVLLELLAIYLDESKAQRETVNEPSSEVKWNEVLAHIEANLHANIQVEELARIAFLHPNYFITSFKSMMGCSPIQYVTNRRIALAKQLLMETDLPVATVATQVGMQNHYLSRLFKRYTGITPLQYRRIGKHNGSLRLQPAKAIIKEEES
ncbi:AraC family transcriptional regulator [Paenibacillus sinopodophylli]|uniref:AraC family transcriptional regulator n=1 Tax=Paenibacillus sinopodophylli TaxID=1837342 RepID=UPI00110CEB67|nr:AraC family transcriptional regulator [Paenibacillus sinopodophylli]